MFDRRDHLGDENSFYRRGLVLGLTLAEVSLLLVFILLLALGALLKNEKAKAAGLADAQTRAEAAERTLSEALATQAGAEASPEVVEQWVRELVSASVRNKENEALRNELAQANAQFAQVREAVGTPGTSNEEVVEALSEELRAAAATRAAREAIEKSEPGSIERQLLDRELENQQLRGAIANARRKLEAAGKGTERPACWATQEGKPEYIFEIGLSAAGFTIRDKALAHRRQQQARLPIQMIAFGRAITLDQFRRQTRPLFEWGESRGCRFFVVAVDRTGSGQKEVFKQRLRGMEEHFYKYLSN